MKICSYTTSGVDTVVPAKITSVSRLSPPAAAAQRRTPLTSANSWGVKPPTTKITTTGLSAGLHGGIGSIRLPVELLLRGGVGMGRERP